jgi:hypothetical protein
MNAKNATSIDVISLHAVVRPCSMVTVTSPTTGKEYLQ